MSYCDNFPTSESVYILSNDPEPLTHECNRKNENLYLCDGTINDGFWKLQKDGDKCRWWHCKNPYKTDDKGKPVYKDGNLDTSDFSDCNITNFPYVIKRVDNDTKCQVSNIFTGEIAEDTCEGGNDCCLKDTICDYDDCFQFKALDKYLISNNLKYKCEGPYCVETELGKGDFSNPFCDYQCPGLAYPTNYTCIDNYCQQVADADAYKDNNPEARFYDNPFCDANCKTPENVSFNCNRENPANPTCETVQDQSGQYKDLTTCTEACSTDINPDDYKTTTDTTQNIPIKNMIILGLIILLNIFIIYAIVFSINKTLAKNSK